MLIWATVAAFSWWPTGRDVRTEDRNGDGRPDVWRTYDRQGQVVERDIDSNFDGRSDVREHYLHGALVDRESDRNFDDRVDLVEEFDATTHEHVRSVVDRDFDGTADLLVLFQAGQPVFSKWAPRPAVSRAVPPRLADAHLGPLGQMTRLSDPFTGDLALRGTPITSETPESVWTAVGLPVASAPTISRIRSAPVVDRLETPSLASSVVGSQSPRGPPLA